MSNIRDEGQVQRGGPVLVQRATASEASLVIQVGRDLYLSDDGLSTYWKPHKTTPGECPFPGLDAYGPSQAKWFFGREDLTGDLLQQLDDSMRAETQAASMCGPVLVVGPSGAGKSSLLGAGLMAALSEGRLPVTGSATWPRLTFTPGAQPLQTLADALEACVKALGHESPETTSWKDGLALLRHAMHQRSGDGSAMRAVIVVDQLEELFTACSDEAQRSDFLDALAVIASSEGDTSPAASVVLGLRADFYAKATGYPALRQAMQFRQIVLGAMTPVEVRRAVTLPAQAAGLTLEGGLAERLLRDLGVDEAGGYEPGRLPLLAHALRATWQRRNGSHLTIAGYEATGGIHGAVAKTAEDVFASLGTVDQQTARQLFLALVRVGEAAGDTDGEGTADTRRRVTVESLYTRSSDPASARAVLDAFAAARLLAPGGHTVQITHEALLWRWPRLRAWINEDRSDHLIRQGIEEAATAWDHEGRDASSLYSGTRLVSAQAWADNPAHRSELSPVARSFLAASGRLRQRGIRRRNGVIAILTALSLAMAGLTAYAFGQRATADTEFTRAEAGVLAAQASAALTDHQPDAAMEFAVAAEQLDPTSPQAVSSLLSMQAQHLTGRLQPADNSDVLGMAYSPDGSQIATSSSDGYLRLWSTATYRQLSDVKLSFGHTSPELDSVSFSPNGKVLASTQPGGVHLWTITGGGHLTSLAVLRAAGETNSPATALAFSPDQHTLVVATGFGTVLLWNLPNNTLKGTISCLCDPTNLAFVGNGRALAMADSISVELWNLAPLDSYAPADAQNVKLQNSVPFSSGPLAVSPDGRTLAFIALDHSIKLWSLSSQRLVATLTDGRTLATSLAFSPDGALLAIGNRDGTVSLWDLRNGPALLDTLSGHRLPVGQVAFSPAGRMLASASQDGTVALWDTRGNTLDARVNSAVAVDFSPNGHLLAVGANLHGGSEVGLFSMPARRLIGTARTGNKFVSAIAFSPDGRLLAVASYNPVGTVEIWNVSSRKLIQKSELRGNYAINTLAFSRDGRLLAFTIAGNFYVFIDDITRMSQVAAIDTSRFDEGVGTASILGTAFSPDGHLLAVAGGDGRSWLFNVASQELVENLELTYADSAESIAFSPDGRTVAVGALYGTVYLYPVHPETSASAAGPLTGFTRYFADSNQPITSVAFGNEGRLLIASGDDGSVRLWDTADSTLLASITASTGKPVSMAYSTSLGIIATADGATVRIWQTNSGQVASGICRMLQAPVSKTNWKTYLPDDPYMPVCT